MLTGPFLHDSPSHREEELSEQELAGLFPTAFWTVAYETRRRFALSRLVSSRIYLRDERSQAPAGDEGLALVLDLMYVVGLPDQRLWVVCVLPGLDDDLATVESLYLVERVA